MNLIDLLLKNAHIVIFVAIGLFTMWTKARKQQRHTGTGMPSFGGPTTEGGGSGRNTAANRGKAQSAPAGSMAAPAGGMAASRSGQTSAQGSVSSRTAMSSGRPGAAAASASRGDEGESQEGMLTLENAVQGVIWAEVLGPPRAKNPHRPR